MKKLILTASLVGVLTLGFAACNTTQPTALPENPNLAEDLAIEDIAYEEDFFPPMLGFGSHTGIVTEVSPLWDGNGYMVSVVVEGSESQTNFMVDHNTANLVNGEITEGMLVTGYFDMSAPMAMIYPPQHHARLLMETASNMAILDRFDENMQAFGSPNSLNIADNTLIVFPTGEAFEGDISELANRLLLVEFEEEGLVIAPIRITVLFEIAVHPTLDLTDEDLAGMDMGIIDIDFPDGGLLLTQEDLDLMWSSMFDPETVQIIVDGEVIEAATPFVDSVAGTVMLPVVAIAEALGYNVVDDGDDSVIIGMGSIVTVGVNSYFVGRMAAFELSAAPALVDDVIFVPWDFFGSVAGAAAYVEDGNIIVIG